MEGVGLHLVALPFTNWGFWAWGYTGRLTCPGVRSLPRPANIALVSYSSPEVKMRESSDWLSALWDLKVGADFLVDTAALLVTSAESRCLARLSREQWLLWLYFPLRLVCFLET